MLRLAWFLEFMKVTVESMYANEDSFAKNIKKAYEKVLAPKHPWLVRQAAGVAMGFAPSKKTVFKCLFGKFI